jgi:hypothetical protein
MHHIRVCAAALAALCFVAPLRADELVALDADWRFQNRCVFLRHSFTIVSPGDLRSLTLGAQSDDGFVAWINGREVARFNMPGGEPTISTDSLPALGEPIAFQTFPVDNPRDFLVTGANVLTVQGFNSSLGASSDFVLNVSLDSTLDTAPLVMERLLPPADAEVITNRNLLFRPSWSVPGHEGLFKSRRGRNGAPHRFTR